MKPLIIIPTYWRGEKEKASDRLFNVYDHPTPLNQSGTLSRTLASLRKLRDDFKVAVIGTVTEPSLKEKFEDKLRSVLSKFNDLDISLFSFSELELLHQRMADLDEKGLIPLISLEGYSNIRNLGLIIGNVLGAVSLLMLDDDEVVVSGDFLAKAFEFVDSSFSGERVLGKAGYYLKNEKGEFLGSDKVPWWDRFWKKGWAMNQVLKTIPHPPRLKRTSLVLGGAMVIHRELFEKIPFDPYIVRGEDIDYLINAKMEGYNFFLDNEFFVLHLPSPGNHVLGMRQDLYRFFYEQAKLDYARKRGKKSVKPESLGLYPGNFLKTSVRRKALVTSFLTSVGDVIQPDFLMHLKNIRIALYDARVFARKNCHRYFGFAYRWRHLLESLKEDEAMKACLLERNV